MTVSDGKFFVYVLFVMKLHDGQVSVWCTIVYIAGVRKCFHNFAQPISEYILKKQSDAEDVHYNTKYNCKSNVLKSRSLILNIRIYNGKTKGWNTYIQAK